MLASESELVRTIIGAAVEVHRTLGPGLLESVYDRCLMVELSSRGLPFQRHVHVPLVYKNTRIPSAFCADFIVEDTILIELKSVSTLLPVHRSQVITYLRLLGLRQGLLINFNSPRLVNGLRNVLVS